MHAVTQARVLSYGIDRAANFTATNLRLSPTGTSFTLEPGAHAIRSRLVGRFNVSNWLAAFAAAVSPVYPVRRDPANVTIVPAGVTSRTELFAVSAMYRFPDLSNANPPGRFNWAALASPPSPEKPAIPFPATVVMIPDVDTFRTTLFRESAM
jgi:UDP-N-acetylmuramyl pentapeptide synthase